MIHAYPRVVPVGGPYEIELRSDIPLFGQSDWYALFTPCESFCNARDAVDIETISGFPVSHTTNRPQRLELTGNDSRTRRVRLSCPAEQEYTLRLFSTASSACLAHAELYAVERDLQNQYPFKGDLHMHSFFSDGEDSPRRMAQECRRKGFDFMALTDHGKYAPSAALCREFSSMPELAMALYPGEEIHLPFHQAHILNIGGRQSVNELFAEAPEAFYDNILRQADPGEMPPQVDPYSFKSALWAFDRIHDFDGMSVFCHPYWRRPSGYELSTDLTESLLRTHAFDALELVSGYPLQELDSNQLQLARYQELKEKPPIVGVSDAHAAEDCLLGSFYTLVLAKNNQFESIRHGILSHQSVAADQIAPGPARLFGSYRLVKYFHFLQRAFFPEHDVLARQESVRMEAWNGQGNHGLKPALDELYHAVFAW